MSDYPLQYTRIVADDDDGTLLVTVSYQPKTNWLFGKQGGRYPNQVEKALHQFAVDRNFSPYDVKLEAGEDK